MGAFFLGGGGPRPAGIGPHIYNFLTGANQGEVVDTGSSYINLINLMFSAWDPFNFDADPDPGSALAKSGSKSGYGKRLFLSNLLNFKAEFSTFFVLFCLFLC